MYKSLCLTRRNNAFKVTQSTTYSGYGNLVIKRDISKIVLIFYAAIGIPFTIATYTYASKLLRSVISAMLEWLEVHVMKWPQVRHKKCQVIYKIMQSFIRTRYFYLTLLQEIVIKGSVKEKSQRRLFCVYFDPFSHKIAKTFHPLKKGVGVKMKQKYGHFSRKSVELPPLQL